MKNLKIEEITEQEYNKFIIGYKNSLFFNSVEWAKFKSASGWNMNIIGLKGGKKIYAAGILLSRTIPILNKKVYYCPRGYIIDYSNFDLIDKFNEQLKKYLKCQKAIFLKINPYVKYQDRDVDGNIISENNKDLVNHLKRIGYKHYGFYVKFSEKKDLEPRWLSVLDLEDKSIDDLVKNMRATTRWLINKSKKNCITIKEAKYENIPEFKKLMQHTAERREFQDRPLQYYQLMYNQLIDKNMFKLLLANINLKELKSNLSADIEHLDSRINTIKNNPKKAGQINEFESQKESLKNKIIDIDKKISKYGDNPLISAGLYLSYGDQVVYLFGGSYKEFMGYGAQYLMQYEMIKYGKNNNYKKLNFYGIDGDFRKKSRYYGLFDFKRGFNAEVVELIGEFDLISNKFYYSLYKLMFYLYKVLKKIKLIVNGVFK